MRSCIMHGHPTHLVQELHVVTVHVISRRCCVILGYNLQPFLTFICITILVYSICIIDNSSAQFKFSIVMILFYCNLLEKNFFPAYNLHVTQRVISVCIHCYPVFVRLTL